MAGYIQKRGNGVYRLLITTRTGGDLKRYSKTVHVPTKKEAELQMSLFIAAIEELKNQPVPESNSESESESEPIPEPDKLTFEQFSAQWIDYSRGRLATKTVFRYEEYLKSRINPHIGFLKLDEIKPMHLAELYVKLQKEPNKCKGRSGTLSNRTILHHHRIIHSILQTAFQWYLVMCNVASKVKPPKVEKPDLPVYTAEEVSLMLTAVEKEILIKKVILWLAITTGVKSV